MTPFKSYIRLSRNAVLLPEWPTAVFFCLVIVVHESLVCPEHLNCLLFFRKILQVPPILWFFNIFVYLNPFQQWLYVNPCFHTDDNWRTHLQLLQKIQTLTDASEGKNMY